MIGVHLIIHGKFLTCLPPLHSKPLTSINRLALGYGRFIPRSFNQHNVWPRRNSSIVTLKLRHHEIDCGCSDLSMPLPNSDHIPDIRVQTKGTVRRLRGVFREPFLHLVFRTDDGVWTSFLQPIKERGNV